ncbi:hypothetical protein ACFFF5_03175 [Lederbergia wuyishanensis]|uniref:Uncharacterized protein n=1 Tax=Lederbergia wuyishanensis TaxID=1347903 RepID=A0ABU0D058_9BACI|nr:hypothetical protein [Lederbergia wuyishanensis]MDQ0341791.1 hypothetical protein [Lederbergia wuyishanensis]
MSSSKAKKHRQKLIREGRRNPEENRSPFAFSDMRTRTTKTKKDQLYKIKYKNHSSHNGNDGFYFFARIANKIHSILLRIYLEFTNALLPVTYIDQTAHLRIIK